MKRFYLIFSLISFLSVACNTLDVYEKTLPVPKQQWSSSNILNFKFTATDSLAYYNIYFVIRHTESYHFNNIWLNFSTVIPGQKPQTQRLPLQLGNSNGWLGTAMDDIIEQRIPVSNNPTRLKKGDYTFSLQQIMREDPLMNVLNVGIRVEKLIQ